MTNTTASIARKSFIKSQRAAVKYDVDNLNGLKSVLKENSFFLVLTFSRDSQLKYYSRTVTHDKIFV